MSGGGVIVVSEIANSLARLGHNITVITPDVRWDGKRYEPSFHSNIEVCRVSVPSSERIKVAARRCKKPMEKEAINIGKNNKLDFILTVFHPFHLAPTAAVNAGQSLGVPVLVKVDDAIYAKSHGLKSIQRRIEKIYLSKTLQKASKVLVSNLESGKTVQNTYGVSKEKISVVPNGVNLSEFYANQDKKNQVVFAGVMYYHRGIDVLLEAVPLVLKEINAEFLLIGDGPEMEKLQEIAKGRNLSDNVKFVGWLDKADIPGYLAESKVGIGPLRKTEVTSNALPIKVLEYMASYLPVIALRETLPEDVLKHRVNGYFVSDSTELAEKIIKLLKDDTLREEMGKKSRDIAQDFDWKKVSEKIIKNYEEI